MSVATTIDKTACGEEVVSFSELQATLNRYCLSLTKSSWDAEDLAQDTWLKAITSLQLGHTNPEALLLRIAKNLWIDQTRRKSVLNRIIQQIKPPEALSDNGFLEMDTALHALTEHMSSLQRTVFLLRDVFEYSAAETAEVLQTTEGAVKAALHRARQSLESVRNDLDNGNVPLAEREEVGELLQAYVVAYQRGDIAALIELARKGKSHHVVLLGNSRACKSWDTFSKHRAKTQFKILMAA